MNSIISQILEIDKEANKRIEQAELRRTQIIGEAKEALIKQQNQVREMSEKNIAKIECSERSELEEKVMNIAKDTKKRKKLLKEKFENFHSEWEDRMFEKIVSC